MVRETPASEQPARLILVSLKFAPVHRMLMQAYRDAFASAHSKVAATWIVADEYARGDCADEWIHAGGGSSYLAIAGGLAGQAARLARKVRNLPDQTGPAHVLIQSTHPLNAYLILLLKRRWPGTNTFYYLHEPSSLREKLSRGHSVVATVMIHFVQLLDLLAADRYYVAHEFAKTHSGRSYLLRNLTQRAIVLPLPFTDLFDAKYHRSRSPESPIRVLLLGNAGAQRCLEVFLEAAAQAHARGLPLTFAILSGSAPRIDSAYRTLPNLELKIGRRYANGEMVEELYRADFVFNVFRSSYTQSGVTPMALMFGVPVIARAFERDLALENAGCIYFESVPSAAQLLEMLLASPGANSAALREHYLRTFDVTSIARRLRDHGA